jgi:hypothetical protein
MILGDPALAAAEAASGSIRVTIDELFRGHVERHPQALALVDPANRKSFTDGEPRRLSYSEADRIVAAIAERLRRMALPSDATVGIQLPNIVENILVMLGVLRAGMIPAQLPLLWRRAEAVTALGRVGAKALITCGHVGAFNHSHFALHLAAEVFFIRYVCAFGQNLPDGVVPFDDLLTADDGEQAPPFERERQGNPSAHVAAVTFDVGEGGLLPVARNHSELLVGGLAVLLESRMAQDSNILSALAPASFAGISLTLVPWLLSGGTLVLHHPFDPDVFARQRQDYRCSTLIVPASVAFHLADAGAFAGQDPASVIAMWRAPERLAASPAWSEPNTVLVDVPVLGEAALIPARRDSGGRPSALPFGPMTAPRHGADAIAVAEFTRTESGTMALRGTMAPGHSFPPGIERSGLPYFQIGRAGWIDTGYACRGDTITKGIVITAPPSGIVSVGGYRFPLRDLQDTTSRIDSSATLAALPDPLIGQRLIGNAADRRTMQKALQAVGVNPLVVAAFRDRNGRGVAHAD